MPETKHVESATLWKNEEYAIKQYESGKDRTKVFETPEDLIKDLRSE